MANFYLSGISGLTKNHQYKTRLKRRLTQTVVFPKFSYTLNVA